MRQTSDLVVDNLRPVPGITLFCQTRNYTPCHFSPPRCIHGFWQHASISNKRKWHLAISFQSGPNFWWPKFANWQPKTCLGSLVCAILKWLISDPGSIFSYGWFCSKSKFCCFLPSLGCSWLCYVAWHAIDTHRLASEEGHGSSQNRHQYFLPGLNVRQMKAVCWTSVWFFSIIFVKFWCDHIGLCRRVKILLTLYMHITLVFLVVKSQCCCNANKNSKKICLKTRSRGTVHF